MVGPQDQIAALEVAGADRVALEVADYAARQLNRLRLGRRAAVGLEPMDLTQEAVGRFLKGSWNWDQAKYPSVIDFLKSRIDSLISNALTSAEYKRGREIPRTAAGLEDVEALAEGDPDGTGIAGVHAVERRPDQVLLDKIDEDIAEKFWNRLEKEAQKTANLKMRDELTKVLIAVYAGKDYSEIAEATDLPPDVVYRRFYKLGVLAEKIARELDS